MAWTAAEREVFIEVREHLDDARNGVRKALVEITRVRHQRAAITDLNQILDSIDRFQSANAEKIMDAVHD